MCRRQMGSPYLRFLGPHHLPLWLPPIRGHGETIDTASKADKCWAANRKGRASRGSKCSRIGASLENGPRRWRLGPPNIRQNAPTQGPPTPWDVSANHARIPGIFQPCYNVKANKRRDSSRRSRQIPRLRPSPPRRPRQGPGRKALDSKSQVPNHKSQITGPPASISHHHPV